MLEGRLGTKLKLFLMFLDFLRSYVLIKTVSKCKFTDSKMKYYDQLFEMFTFVLKHGTIVPWLNVVSKDSTFKKERFWLKKETLIGGITTNEN